MPRKISPTGVEGPKKGTIKHGEVITDILMSKWKLGKPIGIGGFGEIYDVVGYGKGGSKGDYVAKVEKHTSGPLFVEINCYLRLGKVDMINKWKQQHNLPFLGLPHFVASGSHMSQGEKYRFLILPKFERDLEAIFQTKKIFNLKTVLVIALRIIDTLEYIHSKGYVHSDIKASNIMLGKTHKSPPKRKSTRSRSPIKRFTPRTPRRIKSTKAVVVASKSKRILRPQSIMNYCEDVELLDLEVKSESREFEGDEVFLLDFGLASKFLSKNGDHREFSLDQRKAHAGTVLFCSRDAHKGIPSRRSDLESLGYNMIYWLTGTLPWVENVDEPAEVEKRKNRCFTDIKRFLNICFDDCPSFLVEMFTHLSKIQFKDQPDYNFFRILFKKTIKEYGYKDNNKLDFDNLEGWGSKQKKLGVKKEKSVFKVPSLLLYSPLKPISSNIIFKRPKLRKKIKDKLAKNSMMNWSKILLPDPETIIREASHKKSCDEDKFNLEDFDLESLNPTPQMREVYNRTYEPVTADYIEGYTAEMMRIYKLMQQTVEEEPRRRGKKRAKKSLSPKREKKVKLTLKRSTRLRG